MMLNCFICLMISGAREQRNSIRPDSPYWKWSKETDQMEGRDQDRQVFLMEF